MKKSVLLLVIALLLSGCKTKTVVVRVPEVRTDTVVITKSQRDSIWRRDSIHVLEKQKGDTVYVEVSRWRTLVRATELHDTLYVATHDSIPYPIEVVKEVPRKLSWWQKVKMNFGLVMIGLIGIGGLLSLMKLRKYLPF